LAFWVDGLVSLQISALREFLIGTKSMVEILVDFPGTFFDTPEEIPIKKFIIPGIM